MVSLSTGSGKFRCQVSRCSHGSSKRHDLLYIDRSPDKSEDMLEISRPDMEVLTYRTKQLLSRFILDTRALNIPACRFGPGSLHTPMHTHSRVRTMHTIESRQYGMGTCNLAMQVGQEYH